MDSRHPKILEFDKDRVTCRLIKAKLWQQLCISHFCRHWHPRDFTDPSSNACAADSHHRNRRPSLQEMTGLTMKQAMKATAVSNLVSTLIGFRIAWGIMVAVEFAILGLIDSSNLVHNSHRRNSRRRRRKPLIFARANRCSQRQSRNLRGYGRVNGDLATHRFAIPL